MAERIVTATDPVCGMPVDPSRGLVLEHDGQRLLFCSDYCRERFLSEPAAFRPVADGAVTGGRPRCIAYLSMEIAERAVLPTFRQRDAWCSIMKHCIALNASFFNTHRMVQQYATSAYLVG